MQKKKGKIPTDTQNVERERMNADISMKEMPQRRIPKD